MKYDCPNCGAFEGSHHRASCSLAGEEVALRYDPPSYAEVTKWLAENRQSLTEQAPGACMVINARDLSYAVGGTHEKAVESYSEHNGPTPPNGRNFLSVRLGPFNQAQGARQTWPWTRSPQAPA